MPRQRITIAILGLGGQGGGVLADWIVQLGENADYVAQGTSVPGTAQRTGTTVYYVEMMPQEGPVDPVLALMPVPGDVDIVIAAELMEAGRAILRGFVTGDRTTLIASTHRIYAIAEKSAPGDGRASERRVLEAARERAQHFIGFDMDAVSERTASVISSVLFGALAGSGALPFARTAFEAAIRAGGKAVEANLAGFEAGFAGAQGRLAEKEPSAPEALRTEGAAGRALLARIRTDLPDAAHVFAVEGARRLLDYQDEAYARHYLDRLAAISSRDGELLRETARHLALWMAYEDTIRVADLKIRASRLERVRADVKAAPGQIVRVTEYMHPRLEEICDTLPAALGRSILASPRLSGQLHRFFAKGRHVETTSLRWFLLLSLLAGFRRWRRGTLRYADEQARIDAWLGLIRDAATRDPALATELAKCQQLIKGYGDTFARGLAKYDRVIAQYRDGKLDAAQLRRLREAALADEEGGAPEATIARVGGSA
ncbi:indolepyruvate oxidoreductase subunit beta family protein [Sphingosinicella terrae]|uniref:indolepyruvate oxidoreductase subunit beta family protein n=1 Tax=Sphingosinicella terrae TaxID=2172047 RepID=UPI000E0D4B24|nr:indolepyruvate oxidoreductase subunit beta family protein [Sphingosinicella terrae]